MKIEELVPTLELCKRIPAGEFEDSMFVWRVPEKSCPLEDKFYDIFVRDRCSAYLRDKQIPAPTAAEILKVLWNDYQKPTVYFRNIWYATVFNDYGDEITEVDNESAANAALRLLFKNKGIEK